MSMNNNSKKRIFIGLSEVAGFGSMYARGLRAIGHNVNFIISKPDLINRDYPCDKCLNIQNSPKILRFIILTIELIKSLFLNDYYIFLYGKSFWPGNYDLALLKLFNKKIMTIFLGCEIRQREEIQKLNRLYDPCRNCSIVCEHRVKAHIAKMFEKYSDIIICQPEYDQLLTRQYEYAWVPLDIEEWKSHSIEANSTLKIVHAPSNSQKKGTEYILDAVDKLKKEGYQFEFFLAKNLSNLELKKHLIEADIIVDQIMIGWYGKLAVESMSLGKPVICWIDNTLQQSVHDLPIISANPTTIYEKLKYLLDNKILLSDIGKNSRKFVEKNHDYKTICTTISDLFEDLN